MTDSSIPSADFEIVESRRLGGADALRSVATGRRLDGDLVERICFALVAQRCLEPASKLAAVQWVGERVAIPDCLDFDDQAAHAAMDFLLASLPEIAERIFLATANLLNLSCDIIFEILLHLLRAGRGRRRGRPRPGQGCRGEGGDR